MSRHFVTRAERSLLPPEARRLIPPLTISLVLHALAFSPAPGVLPSPDSVAVRQSDLHANLHRAPVALPIEEPSFIPAVPRGKAPMRQPETRIHSRPVSRPAPQTVPESPVEQVHPAGQPDRAIEPMRTGIDVAGLRQYHLALGQKARQFRRFPEEARVAGYKGRVTMRLAVSETGRPLGISLLDSSSFRILDQAALDMMTLAASHTEIPDSLRGRAFTIDLAVDYNPEDAP